MECKYPKFWNLEKKACEECPENTIMNIETGKCEKCPEDKPVILNGACVGCPAGTTFVDGKCVEKPV